MSKFQTELQETGFVFMDFVQMGLRMVMSFPLMFIGVILAGLLTTRGAKKKVKLGKLFDVQF